MTHQNDFASARHINKTIGKSESAFSGSIYLLSCKKQEAIVRVTLLAIYSDPILWKKDQSSSLKLKLVIKNDSGLVLDFFLYAIEVSNPKNQVIAFDVNLSTLSEGKYVIEIELLSPDGLTLPKHQDHFCAFQYEVNQALQRWINALPSFLSLISIQSTEWSQPTILSIKGSVRNLGYRHWQRKPGMGSVKLGGILTRKNSEETEIVSEYRYEMSHETIPSGDSFEFIIIISVAGLEVGNYELILDMVKEGDFWFRQYFGDAGVSLKFEITEKPPTISFVNDPYLPDRIQSWKTFCSKVIWICPTLPEFDQSTGGKRLFTILQAQRALGLEILFLYEYESSRGDVYKDALKQLGVDTFGNPLGYLIEHPQPPEALIIIGWYPCATRNLSAIRSLQPKNKVILDSVDIHWMRNERAAHQGLTSDSMTSLDIDKKDELNAYSSVDEVWVVSEVDRKELLSELPNCPTKVIPVPLPPRNQFETRKQKTHIPEVVFVGGFNHPPNTSAALWAAEICKKVREKFNLSLHLHIIGANPPLEVSRLHDNEHTFVHGFVEDLTPIYSRASAALVPLKFGAGVKGKLIEALSFGIPVISNDIGIEGLDLNSCLNQFIGNSTESLADCLAWALQNPEASSDIAKNAYQYLEGSIGTEPFTTALYHTSHVPPVTIIIVTYNKKELLQKCLESLIEHTIYPNFRIAVWSNGCTDGTVEYLKDLRIRYSKILDIHLHSSNEYFIKPNNELIKIYESDDIVLINNDIEFTDSKWLFALSDAAYTSSTVASAGGLTLDANGLALEAGARILPNGFGINEFRGSQISEPEIDKFRYVGFCSGCFLYLRRDALNIIGLLDEQYHPMYFEDCDWQYRAHQKGLKTIYTPYARAIHREGSSAGTDTSVGLKQFQEINRAKFIQRFSGVIKNLQY